jgi:hypothetical protein
MAKIGKHGFGSCDCKNYASKRDPAVVLVAFEEVIDVVRVERLEDGWVILGDVVNANEGDANEPEEDGGGKGVAHFISSKTLHTEQHHQDGHRHPHHHICTHNKPRQTSEL